MAFPIFHVLAIRGGIIIVNVTFIFEKGKGGGRILEKGGKRED